MNVDVQSKWILAIECAVDRGSVSVVRGKLEGKSYSGTTRSPSRAEDLLIVVQELMSESNISLDDVGTIAVSTGPGSYSGIRIGIATALGLRAATGAGCVGIPVLEAMAASADGPTVISAVPVGRKDVAWQVFYKSQEDRSPKARLTPFMDFIDECGRVANAALAVPESLAIRLADMPDVGLHVENLGSNLSELIGRSALTQVADSVLNPIYLRNESHSTPGF